MSSSINKLGNHLRRFWRETLIAIGFMFFFLIYYLPLNRNILYLGMLLALGVFLTAIFTHPGKALIVLFGCVLLGISPAQVPQGVFVKPISSTEIIPAASDSLIFVESNSLDQLEPLVVWRYVFEVYNLDSYEQECGDNLQGSLIIDGINLSGLIVRVGENRVENPEKLLYPKYFLDEIRVLLGNQTFGEIIISLSFDEGIPPKIFLGTEAHGFTHYSDAVWLEYANEKCAVIYHAQRQVVKQ